MHGETDRVLARARRVMAERIWPAVHAERRPLEVEAWTVDGEPVAVEVARAATYRPFAVGEAWGTPWSTTWFRLRGEVPDGWHGPIEVVVQLSDPEPVGFGAEGLVFRTDGGGPVQGLHPDHVAVAAELVTVDGGGAVDLLVEAAANPDLGRSHAPTPMGDPATAGTRLLHHLRRAELARRDDAARHLLLDLEVAVDLAGAVADREPRHHELAAAVADALDRLDPGDVAGTASWARMALVGALGRHNASGAHRVTAVGHAHIDTAWLWPLRETRRKCARSFSTAVTLMEGPHPEHRFVCSQAVQHDWIARDHPELFRRIAAQVAAGRFVPVGSMWVEADTNLPSGESLARQLVHGKRWFLSTYGIETDDVWLPDVFGYSAQLPQLMRHAGCRWFLTQKLSWNDTNAFPHHTFRWEALDGSRVLAHFPPVDTYNATLRADELVESVRRFRDHGRSNRSLVPFGHGDGGGGPTSDMLERARRLVDLDGVPRVRVEPPSAFFAAVDAEMGDDAPVWRGELYFEAHRGTYTSQARTKVGNRRVELALRELELWSVAAGTAPLDDLERWWKALLVHQFHDILPGSSIAWVHAETEVAHRRLLDEVGAATLEALDAVVPPGGEVAANAGPFPVRGVVVGGGVARWVDAPAHGLGTVAAELPGGVDPVQLGVGTEDGETTVTNGLVTVVVAADGTLASVRDQRADRECLAGPGNVLELLADDPIRYDAWDLDEHVVGGTPTLVTDVVERGVESHGTWAEVRVVRSTPAGSRIDQRYVVRAGSARVDVVTDIDWHDRERLLKAAFDLDVRADDARFEIQYGHVRRPTHRNTSWDAARFEVCAHTWADLSEPDFGVALLNDGRYGHDVLGGRLRLSLLRGARYPDPGADLGAHRFTYSLLPHGRGLGDVLAAAWELNLPPRLVTGGSGRTEVGRPVVRVDHPGVVVTAVKPADDGSGDLIVRLHEAFGGRARFRLDVSTDHGEPIPCDLLEREVDGPRGWDRELRPFRIETLRLPRSPREASAGPAD